MFLSFGEEVIALSNAVHHDRLEEFFVDVGNPVESLSLTVVFESLRVTAFIEQLLDD